MLLLNRESSNGNTGKVENGSTPAQGYNRKQQG